MSETPIRDQRIASALRLLEVPEHGPDFWAALEARLAAVADEQDSMARSDTGPGGDLIALEPPAGRRRSARRQHWLLRAAVVLVLAGALGTIVVWAARDRDRPTAVTAADVADQMTALLGAAQTLTGTLRTTNTSADGPPVVHEYRFVRTSEGSFRVTDVASGADEAYNAATGVHRILNVDAGPAPLAIEELNVAAGPPDPEPSFAFGDALTGMLQSLDGNGTAIIEEGTENGRPVWIIDTDVQPDQLGGPDAPDHLRVVVDQATVTPLRITRTSGGRPVDDIEIVALAVDEPVGADMFTFEFPAGVEVAPPIDYGFARVASVSDAAEAAGYAAPEPTTIPDGWRLTTVTVAAEAQGTGAERLNPPSIDVITLVYNKGFERFTITTRRNIDPDGFGWTDPFGVEGLDQPSDQVVLDRGRFAGVTADVVSGVPPFTPHLWFVTSELVVTVGGNLTADELVAVVESIP